MSISCYKTFFLVLSSRSCVICQGRGQISRAVFEKMAVARALVFHKHICFLFLAPLAIGQRAYVMVCCPSRVRASSRASVRPCVNFFFNPFPNDKIQTLPN